MTNSTFLPPILDELEEGIDDDEVFTDLSCHGIDDEVTKICDIFKVLLSLHELVDIDLPSSIILQH